MGASATQTGLSPTAEPVPVSSPSGASIPSAVGASMWRSGAGLTVEAVDRVRAKWNKRRQRSRVLREFDAELDEVLQFVIDRTRSAKPHDYPSAAALCTSINTLAASAIEARSAAAPKSDAVHESAVPKGDAHD